MESMSADHGVPQPQGVTPPTAWANRIPFTATSAEKASLLVSYLMAYLYVSAFFTADTSPALKVAEVVFSVLFCAAVEWVYRAEKAGWESWVWLGCAAVILVSILAGRCRAVPGVAMLLYHAYVVYWLLARSGRLMEGKSGRFLPLDVCHGFFAFPLSHLFLRIQVLFYREEKGGEKKKTVWPAVGAVALAAVLFYGAARLLGEADGEFHALTKDLLDWITLPKLPEYGTRLLLSLPVGAYLFGLVLGTAREKPQALRERAGRITAGAEKLRRVPPAVWNMLLGAFCLLYLLFFVIQGSYLFGAFTRTLPESFTVSFYARRGFFELCWVMALNFLLLGAVTVSSRTPAGQSKSTKIMCTALLGESFLLAVTAFSKLALYISCFGFTPLRLESSWLVCVLAAGCAAAMVWLWSEKKTARVWILFSGVTLALLHLY